MACGPCNQECEQGGKCTARRPQSFGLHPVLQLLGSFFGELRYRIARMRARHIHPCAPADLLMPRALEIANTRRP